MDENADPDLQALAGEIQHLREDFTRIRAVLEELIRHRGGAAAAQATKTAERAWDEVNRTAESAAHKLEERPLTTIGSAFGIGLLLGLLFSGRRH